MVATCLIAAFAIAAVATSTASAKSPEWGKCEAQAGGKYSDANCQVKAKGKGAGSFEWHKGATLPNVPFTGASTGGGGLLWGGIFECRDQKTPLTKTPPSRSACEAMGGTPNVNGELGIECEKENSSGEASGKSSIVNVHVTFKGCLLLGISPCKTEGHAEGEIVTNLLKGKLGVINAATKEIGALLEPATKHGTFASFKCEPQDYIKVGVGNKKEGAFWLPENKGGSDQVISPITPINQMTSSFTQVYSAPESEEPVNIPTNFEKKARSGLEVQLNLEQEGKVGGQTMWSAAGEEITNVNTPEKPGEIKF